jgi:hypothetical protein
MSVYSFLRRATFFAWQLEFVSYAPDLPIAQPHSSFLPNFESVRIGMSSQITYDGLRIAGLIADVCKLRLDSYFPNSAELGIEGFENFHRQQFCLGEAPSPCCPLVRLAIARFGVDPFGAPAVIVVSRKQVAAVDVAPCVDANAAIERSEDGRRAAIRSNGIKTKTRFGHGGGHLLGGEGGHPGDARFSRPVATPAAINGSTLTH